MTTPVSQILRKELVKPNALNILTFFYDGWFEELLVKTPHKFFGPKNSFLVPGPQHPSLCYIPNQINQISKDIRSIKIQGAKNIALAGFKAYKLFPTKQTKKKIISIRPTEPFLINLLNKEDKIDYNK